jgi:YidC/Oxa1 family membrane protein insertase
LSALPRFFYDWRQYRAFKRLDRPARQIVIYAESGQDWHHFAPIIRELTGRYQKTICYVSSDPDDPGLSQSNPRILPFCIGTGLFRIMFFQMLEADVMLTQLLDLDNLDLKRSVNPVHYIYMFHSLISTHMADHANSFDHYDSILCAAPHQKKEIRKRESLHGLVPKRLFEHGYHRLEQLIEERREPPAINDRSDIHVLLAPSWGDQTILNVCGHELVGVLLDAGFRLTVRPHFQTRWNTPEVLDAIIQSFGNHPRFALIEQMGESSSLYDSHIMITDWSGAGMDYGLGLEKPVLYIDVPPKARNDTYEELGMEPFESYVRDKIGAITPPDRLAEVPAKILQLLEDPGRFSQRIRQLRAERVYNLGRSADAAAAAIVAIADESAGARR